MAVLLVLTSCGVLGGAAFWAGNSLDSMAKSLPRQLEEARDLGLVTSLSQLRVVIKDPRADAYPELRAGYERWRKLSRADMVSIEQLTRRVLRERATPEEKQRFRQWLDDHPELHHHLLRAATRPACSVPEVETWRHPQLTAYGSFLRESVRIIGARALLAGQAHDIPTAEKLLRLGIGLSQHMSAQPSYVGFSRRSIAELELQRVLERVVVSNQDSPQAMANLLERSQPLFGPLLAASEFLRGEPALMLEALSDPKRTGLENVPGGQFFADVGKSGALEVWNRYYRKLPSDPEDQNNAERVLIAMDKEARDTPYYGSYVSGYDSLMRTLRDVLARRHLAQASIAYLRSGQIGTLPEDPHSGNPLLMKETPTGIIIYSVGQDQQDNGGKEREFGPKASPYSDLIARLPKLSPTSEHS
jgi:hypothetical protein